MNARLARRRDRLKWLIPALLLAAVLGAVAWWMNSRRPVSTLPVQTETAARRTITVTVEATGTVEPVDIVEIKSKASGQIVTMPVEVGSKVSQGDLLAQIDQRDVQNEYDQARAALVAAEAQARISLAQKQRADGLYGEQVITVDEFETATLAAANADAALVKARTNVDLARQRLEEATVQAPIAGTVIEQLATSGQVISSATSSASGGTALLRMADLGRIQVRALVSETDIGQIRPGQSVTVTMDAYPDRPFSGTVEKVEPQAVVQQSVTMFPVLVAVRNDSGQLLPGMNGEIAVLVAQRDDVLAVPVDAVRSARELPTVAAVLGADAEVTRAQLAAGSSRQGAGPARADSLGPARPRERMPAGRAIASPGKATAGSSRNAGVRGFAGASGPDFPGADLPSPPPEFTGEESPVTPDPNAARAVLLSTGKGFEARRVRVGLSDFDYSEILSGVREGEHVVLLSVAEVQAKRTQEQSHVKERMSSAMPGTPPPGGPPLGGGGGR